MAYYSGVNCIIIFVISKNVLYNAHTINLNYWKTEKEKYKLTAHSLFIYSHYLVFYLLLMLWLLLLLLFFFLNTIVVA